MKPLKKQKIKYLVFFLIFALPVIVIGIASAQEIVSSTGDYYKSSSGSISFTVGEPISETCEGSFNFFTQGFHQTKLTITPIFNLPETDFIISVYPNPTFDYVILNFENVNLEDIYCRIFNLNGKLLYNKKVTQREYRIPLHKFSTSTYLLNVVRRNDLIKTFKIEKH